MMGENCVCLGSKGKGYPRIEIDHITDSLLKLQIKIGVHLINVELLHGDPVACNSLLCF